MCRRPPIQSGTHPVRTFNCCLFPQSSPADGGRAQRWQVSHRGKVDHQVNRHATLKELDQPPWESGAQRTFWQRSSAGNAPRCPVPSRIGPPWPLKSTPLVASPAPLSHAGRASVQSSDAFLRWTHRLAIMPPAENPLMAKPVRFAPGLFRVLARAVDGDQSALSRQSHHRRHDSFKVA